MLFFLESLSMSQKSVHLQCVFHSIRFKVNKGWSTAVLLFLCPKLNFGTFFLYFHPLILPILGKEKSLNFFEIQGFTSFFFS